jgi:hypothetical protein
MTENTLSNLIFDAERRIGSYVISIINQHPELAQDSYIAEQYEKIKRWSKEIEGGEE